MADQASNRFFDTGFSNDEEDNDQGYNSEAAEAIKGGRRVPTNGRSEQPRSKKRKISPVSEEEGSDEEREILESPPRYSSKIVDRDSLVAKDGNIKPDKTQQYEELSTLPRPTNLDKRSPQKQPPPTSTSPSDKHHTKKEKKQKATRPSKPGVIYLSSLPPYLKPSALRNLLSQRGFVPITRMFLTPTTSPTSTTSSRSTNKRQSYSEGWIEFASRRTAKLAVESMNAQIIGGKKGGWYRDDLLNMRYLSGLGWDELMAQFREERREEEVRREGERDRARRETKAFLEGVERGKVVEGIQKKRKSKRKKNDDERGGDEGGMGDGMVGRTWEQFAVQDPQQRKGNGKTAENRDFVSDDVKRVLGKIF